MEIEREELFELGLREQAWRKMQERRNSCLQNHDSAGAIQEEDNFIREHDPIHYDEMRASGQLGWQQYDDQSAHEDFVDSMDD